MDFAETKSNPPVNERRVAGDEQCKRLTFGCPKKTRDLPNVSECQACGFRVDASAGKARIRLLYSEWRILLLCKVCLVRVESSKICSYCFRDASMEDCVRCCQCGRSLHSSCFQKYRTVPVCSCNSLPGKEFLICVDCWVPISIAKKRPVLKSMRICEHGMGLNPGDMNRGVGLHGKNIKPVKLREMGLKNAVELDQNLLDLETSEADSCESGQNRDLHPIVSVETNPLKPNIRVYGRNGTNLCNNDHSTDNPSEEKLIDRNGNSRARCLNVYARNRWRNGKNLWIINDGYTKVEALTPKGQEGCSRKVMNVYVRKRWKNGKVCGFQKKEEGQERGSTEKLNGDSHESNSRLPELVVLIDEEEKISVKPMEVYSRVRLKKGGCTQKHSGDNLNTEMQPDG